MPKFLLAVGLSLSVLWGAPTGAAFAQQPPSKATVAAAEELFKAMDYSVRFQETLENLIDVQIQQNPQLKPYRDVMMRFFNKYMSWESMRGDIVSLYSNTFSAEELRQLAAFYRTPLGQKALKEMPRLTAQGAALGQQRVREHEKEFFEMMREAKAAREKAD